MRLVFLSFFMAALFSNGVLAKGAGLTEWYISKKIERANYCKTKEDCVIADFGCPFGCGTYVNKVEQNALEKLVKDYFQSNNEECVYDCVGPHRPDCVSGRCVAAICEIDKAYDRGDDCICPEGTFSTGYANTSSKCIHPVKIFNYMAVLNKQISAEDFKLIAGQIFTLFPQDKYRPVVLEDFARNLTSEWQTRHSASAVWKTQVTNSGLIWTDFEEKMLNNGWGRKPAQGECAGQCMIIDNQWSTHTAQMESVFGADLPKVQFLLQRIQLPNGPLYTFLVKFQDYLATKAKPDLDPNRLNVVMNEFLLFNSSSAPLEQQNNNPEILP